MELQRRWLIDRQMPRTQESMYRKPLFEQIKQEPKSQQQQLTQAITEYILYDS